MQSYGLVVLNIKNLYEILDLIKNHNMQASEVYIRLRYIIRHLPTNNYYMELYDNGLQEYTLLWINNTLAHINKINYLTNKPIWWYSGADYERI